MAHFGSNRGSEAKTYYPELLSECYPALFTSVANKLLSYFADAEITDTDRMILSTLADRLWFVRRSLVPGVYDNAPSPYNKILRFSIQYDTNGYSSREELMGKWQEDDEWGTSMGNFDSDALYEGYSPELAMMVVGAVRLVDEYGWRTHSYFKTHPDLEKAGMGSFFFTHLFNLKQVLAPDNSSAKIVHHVTDVSEGNWTTKKVLASGLPVKEVKKNRVYEVME